MCGNIGYGLTGSDIHASPGWVMKIWHQVRQARRGLGKRGRESIRIPADFRQRHPYWPTLRSLNSGNRQWISGVIDHHAIPRPGHHPQYQRKPADGTVDHHHLVCPGGKTPRGIACGNSLAQRRQPKLIVARQREVLGNGRKRMGIGLVDLWPGMEGGCGEIQGGTRCGKGRNGAGIREDHARPAAVAAFKITLFTQMGEGAADGRPADIQRCGQLPFARQSRIQCQPPVKDQQTQRVGQLAPERGAGGGLLPVA